MKKLPSEQAEKTINDTCQMGFSIGGIKDPAWVVDHDKLEKYLITNTEEETVLFGLQERVIKAGLGFAVVRGWSPEKEMRKK